jgi:hypothetical protein
VNNKLSVNMCFAKIYNREHNNTLRLSILLTNTSQNTSNRLLNNKNFDCAAILNDDFSTGNF